MICQNLQPNGPAVGVSAIMSHSHFIYLAEASVRSNIQVKISEEGQPDPEITGAESFAQGAQQQHYVSSYGT